MKNILFVSPTLDGMGGISSVVRTLMNSDLKNRCKISHYSSYVDKSFYHKLISIITGYIKFPFFLLKNRDIEIVHIHGSMRISFLRKSYYMLLSKLAQKTVIYHMHSSMVNEYFDRNNKFKGAIIKKLMNQYDAFIVLSSYWEQVVKKYTNSTIFVTHNPVSEINAPSCSKNFNDNNNVLFLGEIGQRKGVHDLIKVAKELKNRNTDVHFHIGGNGNIDVYKKQADKLNVSETITWYGWVRGEEKEQLYRNCSIYFLPSYFEGLPMSILEAMGKGFPVISTRVSAIPESVIHQRNGYIYSPGDITGFANGIEHMLSNPKLLFNMSRESVKIINEKFSIEKIVSQLYTVYNSV
ncbi:glycosyltransferase family 4 protein [Chitinispirillales bacterium ANBcel5]|uniref:glycosyltransferase family 4 protein n=1 Tax=Cellulosispirillum alkaliphilum TaxID=3039283 RepID=UPI002A535976|nr:glycosyltransferase family 4 protein [Chitinispirillales bacterium ANBcel5]